MCARSSAYPSFFFLLSSDLEELCCCCCVFAFRLCVGLYFILHTFIHVYGLWLKSIEIVTWFLFLSTHRDLDWIKTIEITHIHHILSKELIRNIIIKSRPKCYTHRVKLTKSFWLEGLRVHSNFSTFCCSISPDYLCVCVCVLPLPPSALLVFFISCNCSYSYVSFTYTLIYFFFMTRPRPTRVQNKLQSD